MMLLAAPPDASMTSCWLALPMLRPSRAPKTSTAALPLTLASGPSGMYAISLHGSKSEYLVTLLTTLRSVPMRRAVVRGEAADPTASPMPSIPAAEVKNQIAKAPMDSGTSMADPFQPSVRMMEGAISCITMVTHPTV